MRTQRDGGLPLQAPRRLNEVPGVSSFAWHAGRLDPSRSVSLSALQPTLRAWIACWAVLRFAELPANTASRARGGFDWRAGHGLRVGAGQGVTIAAAGYSDLARPGTPASASAAAARPAFQGAPAPSPPLGASVVVARWVGTSVKPSR